MLKARVMTITPDIAEQMLSKNTENYRAINHRRVETYAREMALGVWQENGEPIHVYEDGTIANGQHRLNAIVKSGASVPMLIVTGIKKDVKTWDRGSTRTVGQILKACNVNLSAQETSALSILKNGFYGAYGADEIREYASKLKDFDIVAFAVAKGASHPMMFKAGIIAAAYCAYATNRITLDEVEQFAKICNSGIPTDGMNNYPPLCFRKTVQAGFKNANGANISGGVAGRRAYFETAYKAMCDFHSGAKRKVVYKPDGNGENVLKEARKYYDTN